MEGLKKLVKLFWDALFPRSCAICKEEGAVLCGACAKQVNIPAWFVHKEEAGVQIFSKVSYKERAIQKLLHAWKYHGDMSAGEWWKMWIAQGEVPHCFTGAIFVPVPLAREAYAERGFNQAEVLALALAQAHGGSVAKLLERRPRKSQAKTEKDARGNIRSASPYFLSAMGEEQKKAGKLLQEIVLVDDVSTTGSTILACADILRKAGVQKVTACTLAFGNGA